MPLLKDRRRRMRDRLCLEAWALKGQVEVGTLATGLTGYAIQSRYEMNRLW